VTATWTTMDPANADINTYLTFSNNPLNRTDPQGLQPIIGPQPSSGDGSMNPPLRYRFPTIDDFLHSLDYERLKYGKLPRIPLPPPPDGPVISALTPWRTNWKYEDYLDNPPLPMRIWRDPMTQGIIRTAPLGATGVAPYLGWGRVCRPVGSVGGTTRVFLNPNVPRLVAVNNGRVVAQSTDTLLSHEEFVRRLNVPNGSWVGTAIKDPNTGRIVGINSRGIMGNMNVAPQSILNVLAGFFE
jgi:hypothetical protein